MPDHEKIAGNELRSAVRHLNEALVRLAHALGNYTFVPDVDASDILEVKEALEGELIPRCARFLEGEATDESPN